MKALTYGKLIEKLLELTDEQKQQPVRVALETTSGIITGVWIAPEPYVNPTGGRYRTHEDCSEDERLCELDIILNTGEVILDGLEPHLNPPEETS